LSEDIIVNIFFEKYGTVPNMANIPFTRDDILRHAHALGFSPPKNVGDVVYPYRYRNALPNEIENSAPEGYTWIIIGTGDAQYSFVKSRNRATVHYPCTSQSGER
jgi:hypothetical protein